MTERAQLQELIEIARCAEQASDRIVFLDLLDKYTDKLDQLVAHGLTNDACDQGLLKTIAELHTSLLERAQIERQDTKSELVSLHKRGKGILAYADLFPKGIAPRPVRKG